MHSRSLQPLRVLEVLSEIFKAHGATCKTDAAAFRLTAEVKADSGTEPPLADESHKAKRQKTGALKIICNHLLLLNCSFRKSLMERRLRSYGGQLRDNGGRASGPSRRAGDPG